MSRLLTSGVTLRLVVALKAEAQPLVEHYRLERDAGFGAFKVFRRGEAALVVSGIGKVAAAAATSYLHLATGGERGAVWLNVGIAGHRSRPVGEAVLAREILDRASGRRWHPALDMGPPCATDQVTTVDRPEREMATPGAFDMEASGFIATARRFAPAQLVHCLKIVSDGPKDDLESLTPRVVRRLVEQHVPTVEAIAEACDRLSV